MGAIRQYYYYWRIERKGASHSWCQSGKDRARDQIKERLQSLWRDLVELAALVLAMVAAVITAVSLYFICGGE